MSVKRTGSPERVETETAAEGFAVPIGGDPNEDWANVFEDVVRRHLAERDSIQPDDAFAHSLDVRPSQIVFAIAPTDAASRLDYFLNVIAQAIEQTNQEMADRKEREKRMVEQTEKDRQTRETAIESKLHDWSEKNPPPQT